MSMSFIKQDKRALVKRLIAMNALNVKYDGKYLTFRYDRHNIRNRVVMKKHLGWVGHWSRGTNTVYYDDDLVKQPKELLSVLVHESVEKYVHDKYDLSDNAEGHYVATMIEQKFARQIGVNWNDYNWRVEFIYRKEMRQNKKPLRQ
jgi:formamidopyrimidine-DNA glycosylase